MPGRRIEDDTAEIHISGEQDTSHGHGVMNDDGIIGFYQAKILHSDNIMAPPAQEIHRGPVDTLVSQ
jgi:hypothetical protein